MLAQPTGTNAEAFRMLRTDVAFASLKAPTCERFWSQAPSRRKASRQPRPTSLSPKPKLGRRITLVDLDLRVPFIDRFFGLSHALGVTDVALGNSTLESRADPDRSRAPGNLPAGGHPGLPESNGHAPEQGLLDVLVAGIRPPDPGRVRRQPPTRRDPPPACASGYDLVIHRHAPDCFVSATR